jgi:hypothetical protein
MTRPHKKSAADSKSSPSAWAPAVDLSRQQLAVAAEGACALFRGFEAMRKIQGQAAHQALQHHSKVAARLQEPCEPADLLAMQVDLMRFDTQAAMQYWQQLAAAAVEMQTQLFGCSAHLLNSDDALETAALLDHWSPVADLVPFLGAASSGPADARTLRQINPRAARLA